MVVKEDRPEIRGMVHTVRHLVVVEEVEGGLTWQRSSCTTCAPRRAPRPPRPAWVAVRARKGKTAGRGTKGTKARYQVSAAFEGGQMPLHMRLPKLKGFKNPFKVEFQVVNLDRISELFPEGGTVGVEDLAARGAVRAGPAGEGPRQRGDHLGRAGERARVLRLGQGEDRRRRRVHHRALNVSGRGSAAGAVASSGVTVTGAGPLLGFPGPGRRPPGWTEMRTWC